MSLETIRQIWGMIGAVVVALNAGWIPDIIQGVFEPAVSELIFTALGAIIAVYQVLKARKGDNPDLPAAYKTGSKSVAWYAINPFASAA